MSAMTTTTESEPLAAPKPHRRNILREVPFLVTVAVVLALLLKAVLIQAFFIPSESMERTLHGCAKCLGDRVLVNKLVYKFRDIHRGEIVVFNGKGTTFQPETTVPPPKNNLQRGIRNIQRWVGLGAPGDRDYIKRVIGIPGDIVACCDDKGRVTVNGRGINEPYVFLTDPASGQMRFTPRTVPPGYLFVMGDHRDASQDSRFNGPIPQSSVVGRAFVIFYPWNRIKVLRVPKTFTGAAASPPLLGLAGAVPVTLLRRRRRLQRHQSAHAGLVTT